MRTRLLAIAILALAGRSIAEPVPFDPPVDRWFSNLQSAVAIDFDQDGDDDIFIYGSEFGEPDAFQVLVNTDGTLAGLESQPFVPPPGVPSSGGISATDLDGDGVMDLRVGSACMLARGNGEFDVLLLPDTTGVSLPRLDTDADGDRDFVADGFIYMNDGSYSGEAPRVATAELGIDYSDPIRLADGTEGCLFYAGRGYRFLVPSGKANTLAVRQLEYLSGPQATSTVLRITADLDGDGVREAFVRQSNGSLCLVHVDADGYRISAVPNDFASSIVAVADIDGNGVQDLIGRRSANQISWFDGSAGGEMVEAPLPAGVAYWYFSPSRLRAPDLDSDGRPDILAIDDDLIRFWRNAGTFPPAPTPTPDPAPLPPESCPDLNGDRGIDAADLLLRQLALPQ